jgi:hypothetical protein
MLVSLDKPPAREGTMSSILLLPEQAASALPKINNATKRIMTGGLRRAATSPLLTFNKEL